MLTFEDFPVGTRLALPAQTVSADEIIAFARDFDPQPFHLDETSAQAGRVGGLIASGWHTCGLMMRMMCEAYLLGSRSQGSAGLDRVSWLAPVRPGDTLSGETQVVAARTSRSMPGVGFLTFRYRLQNQAGPVLAVEGNGMMLTRDAPEPAAIPARTGDGHPPAASVDPLPGDTAWERIATGMTVDMGETTFEAGETVAFAEQFDPQRFHLDARAAAHSHFGRLSASGWHTCAVWMRHNVLLGRPRLAAMLGLDEDRLTFGPSPGLRNLRWTYPVFAGDRIRFRKTITGKRVSTRDPATGIVMSHSTGWNQDGVQVLSMDGAVTMPIAG